MTNEELALRITIIKKAIENKRPMGLHYQGLYREACPHLLGKTKDGRFVLHAFQYGGTSSKGPITPQTGAWRFFYLDEPGDITSYDVPSTWYPQDLQKSDAEYLPPKFIVEVLAIVS